MTTKSVPKLDPTHKHSGPYDEQLLKDSIADPLSLSNYSIDEKVDFSDKGR